MIRFALLLLLAIAPGLHAADFGKVPLPASFPVRDSNAVIEIQGLPAIAVVGLIMPNLVTSVREIILRTRPQMLYVDSPGGDIRSAMVLAALIREHNIHLVVAGRCYSACANYLFIGSPLKSILPGSLVAIHGKRTWYTDKNGRIRELAANVESLERLTGDPSAPRELKRDLNSERDFYHEIGYDSTYHEAFERYESRAANLGSAPEVAGCPKIELWALSKEDFAHMGIRGLRASWTPNSLAEARSTAIQLGQDPDRIYFGSLSEFNKFCAPSSFTDKIKHFLNWN